MRTWHIFLLFLPMWIFTYLPIISTYVDIYSYKYDHIVE